MIVFIRVDSRAAGKYSQMYLWSPWNAFSTVLQGFCFCTFLETIPGVEGKSTLAVPLFL